MNYFKRLKDDEIEVGYECPRCKLENSFTVGRNAPYVIPGVRYPMSSKGPVTVVDPTRDRWYNGSWGIWGSQICTGSREGFTGCGDSIDVVELFKECLRACEILACDGCGEDQDKHGLCADCMCPCCAGDVAECKCHIETRGHKEELISDDQGTVYGYSEELYCTTHRQYMDGEV